jgi:hypothetical protein
MVEVEVQAATHSSICSDRIRHLYLETPLFEIATTTLLFKHGTVEGFQKDGLRERLADRLSMA